MTNVHRKYNPLGQILAVTTLADCNGQGEQEDEEDKQELKNTHSHKRRQHQRTSNYWVNTAAI